MTKAKKWAQQTEVNLRDGRFFKESESIKHTVNELVERFIEEMEIRSFQIDQQLHSNASLVEPGVGTLEIE